MERESQPQAGYLLHLVSHIVDEEAVELVEELGVMLGRWSVGTERVVAAGEGRRAVAVQRLGSIRAQSNRVLLL